MNYFIQFALQLVVMLMVALFFGQIMRHIKQPAVLGELLGGLFIGVTVLGTFFPEVYNWIFQSSENVVLIREVFIKIGMLFFMFTAGLEINLTDLNDIGKKALIIGLVGTILPILAGIGLVYIIPHYFWGTLVQDHFFTFSLFIGINLANSANPVIARILMDIGYRKDKLGTTIMAATLVDDIINWILFAFILNETTSATSSTDFDLDLVIKILIIIILFLTIFIISRKFSKKALYLINKRIGMGGFIAFTALVIIVISSLTEFIGIHAFLGAFLVGVMFSSSSEETHKSYEVIEKFSTNFFAPIYFVSIGMGTNFFRNFDLILTLAILITACIAKFGSVLLGAKLAGMKINKEVMAIASGLNARGATGIILAGVGLANGLIDNRIFVAIFTMAFVTSFMSGIMMNFFLSGFGSRKNKIQNKEKLVGRD